MKESIIDKLMKNIDSYRRDNKGKSPYAISISREDLHYLKKELYESTNNLYFNPSSEDDNEFTFMGVRLNIEERSNHDPRRTHRTAIKPW